VQGDEGLARRLEPHLELAEARKAGHSTPVVEPTSESAGDSPRRPLL